MNSRERVMAIVNRQPVDRMPVDLWYTPEVARSLEAHFEKPLGPELFRAMGLDKIIWFNPEDREPRDVMETVWGVPLREQHAGAATYLELGAPPLAGCTTTAELDAYPGWLDPDRFDYETLRRTLGDLDGEYATLGPWVSFFEIYCQMRGLEQAMVDLLIDPDFVTHALDRIEETQTVMLERVFAAAGDLIDFNFISDDMGGQGNLLISLEQWDYHFKARMQRWCDFTHAQGAKVVYHSDGAVGPLIPRLINCRIDVLNPIQHVCPGMECETLQRDFGGQLIFYGGIDNQNVLPFGTPDDVRRETVHCLKTLGAGGQGYICCSCHNAQAGTPVANILAMIETVQSYAP